MNLRLGFSVVFICTSAGFVVDSQEYVMGSSADFPLPFNRVLNLTEPRLQGRDVMILQSLLRRHRGVSIRVTGTFDENTKEVLQIFQNDVNIIPSDGVLNVITAKQVLDQLMYDNYKDNGSIPDGAKFKVYIPVYKDRSIETTAVLYGSDGAVLHKFKARTHGSKTNGYNLNQLSTNGNTPTGFSTMDLNTKEPIEKSFGPYPVLRIVKGISGNSAIGKDNHLGVDGPDTFLSDYRTGILVHTGEWDHWEEGDPMPNSNGCVHVSPRDQKIIVEILQTQCKCVANENPFGKLPYPYKTQGYVSIEQLD